MAEKNGKKKSRRDDSLKEISRRLHPEANHNPVANRPLEVKGARKAPLRANSARSRLSLFALD